MDPTYFCRQAEFATFEADCFDVPCEFVRVHFDNLIDHYNRESHDSSIDFPSWAFERYLREAVA